MREQERFKDMLAKLIDDTENHKIQSSQELIQALVYELTNGHTKMGRNGNTKTEFVN